MLLILSIHQLLDNELIADCMWLVDQHPNSRIRLKLEVACVSYVLLLSSLIFLSTTKDGMGVGSLFILESYSRLVCIWWKCWNNLEFRAPVETSVFQIKPILIGSVSDQPLEMLEVRHLIKTQLVAVLEVLLVLLRAIFAQFGRCKRLFHSTEIFKARWFSSRIDVLPRKLSKSEVDHNIAESEQVVSAWQLVSQVRIYGYKPGSADQVFSCPKLDVFLCFFEEDGTGESEVDHMNNWGFFANTRHDIVRLDVSVYNSFFVHMLYPQ